MKAKFVVHLVCCGSLLLLILLGVNAGLILGLLRNNPLVFPLGLALIAGVVYYVWRYKYARRRSRSEIPSSQIQADKGRNM